MFARLPGFRLHDGLVEQSGANNFTAVCHTFLIWEMGSVKDLLSKYIKDV